MCACVGFDCVRLVFHQISVNTTCGGCTDSQRGQNGETDIVISCIFKNSLCVDQVQVGVVKQGVKTLDEARRRQAPFSPAIPLPHPTPRSRPANSGLSLDRQVAHHITLPLVATITLSYSIFVQFYMGSLRIISYRAALMNPSAGPCSCTIGPLTRSVWCSVSPMAKLGGLKLPLLSYPVS